MSPTIKLRNAFVKILPFCAFFAMTTVIAAIVWEYTAADLYDCTDPVLPGYLSPGDWVHAWGHHPVAIAQQVVHARSMGEPDTVKAGWSVSRLWYLWLSFFAPSVVISLLLTRRVGKVRWFRRERSGWYPPRDRRFQLVAQK